MTYMASDCICHPVTFQWFSIQILVFPIPYSYIAPVPFLGIDLLWKNH